VLLSLIALVIGVWSWMAYNALARTEPLVVMAADVPPGTRLTSDMLKVVHVPPKRDASLHGLADASALVGTYTRVQLKKDDILRPDYVQPAPLDQHVYTNDTFPAETLNADVFQLSPKGISSVTAQDHLNILVLVSPEHGANPSFSVGDMDRPGSGPRVVRVLRNINVLHVTDQAVYLEVTHAQSQYLWALAAAQIDFVGEITTTPNAPLGPLRVSDASLVFLSMADDTQKPAFSINGQGDSGSATPQPTSAPAPSTVVPEPLRIPSSIVHVATTA
jgi:hypothetical protein